MFPSLVVFGLLCIHSVEAAVSASAVASQFSLTTSTTLPFPSATLASTDTQAQIVSNWGLSKGRIQNGPGDLSYVADSIDKTTQGPTLQVLYPAGSFSHDTGGAQLLNLWNSTDSSKFQSMLLSYDVAFDNGFDWVKGGKLPGIRGGINATGCSGGNQPTGLDCFSTRLMWRPSGVGEVYAYMQRGNDLCSDPNITCNDDFGISVQRGAFVFTSGKWFTISLLVQMNNPVNVANGNLVLYVDGVKVIEQQNLQFRKTSAITANGLYFSTFFGGSDDSWATQVDTHTYYRNISMWASEEPSTLTGQVVSGAQRISSGGMVLALVAAVFVLLV